jgi:hypothetical protein
MIGIPNMWSSDEEWKFYVKKATIQLCFFIFFASMLLISIIRVISTNPGGIPEEREWDMNSEIDSTDGDEGRMLYSDEKKYQ